MGGGIQKNKGGVGRVERGRRGKSLPGGQLGNEVAASPEEHPPLLHILSSATGQQGVITMMIFSAVLFPWYCAVFLRTWPNSLFFSCLRCF